MKNLYVFYDTVSGNCGDVFQAENDLVMHRSAVRAMASVPPEIARDTVVLHLGTIDYDEHGTPAVLPCTPVRTAFSGTSPEVEQVRSELMVQAQLYSSFAGGDSIAE